MACPNGGNPATAKKVKSNNVKLLLFVGETAYALAGQRNLTITKTAATTEVSDKDSGGHDEFIYANRNSTLDVDGVVIIDDYTQDAVETAQEDGCEVLVMEQVKANDGTITTKEGWALITNIGKGAAKDDVYTYTISLQVNGKWNATPKYVAA